MKYTLISSTCNSAPRRSNSPRRAFTLIELLVVISIIALLAGLLLPALSAGKTSARKKRALLEVNQIAVAIREYESAYNRWPVSTAAVAASAGGDATFGTAGVANNGILGGPIQSAYLANNSEVMAILLDLVTFPNGVATVNANHVKNPLQTKFLTASMAGDVSSPGIGSDGVYRDPWGNPYIITMDLNGDEKARDAFYSLPRISGGGLNGLVLNATVNPNVYEATTPVMVWSAGPDKAIDPSISGSSGVNKDNILSWKGH
jgi:prepilin-type N-terminal cleavage/methylation domain-containing protein